MINNANNIQEFMDKSKVASLMLECHKITEKDFIHYDNPFGFISALFYEVLGVLLNEDELLDSCGVDECIPGDIMILGNKDDPSNVLYVIVLGYINKCYVFYNQNENRVIIAEDILVQNGYEFIKSVRVLGG